MSGQTGRKIKQRRIRKSMDDIGIGRSSSNLRTSANARNRRLGADDSDLSPAPRRDAGAPAPRRRVMPVGVQLKRKREELERKLGQYREQLKNAELEAAATIRDIIGEVEQQLDAVKRQEKTELERQLEQYRERLKETGSEAETIGDIIRELERRDPQTRQERAKLERDLERYRDRLKGTDAEAKTIRDLIEEVKGELASVVMDVSPGNWKQSPMIRASRVDTAFGARPVNQWIGLKSMLEAYRDTDHDVPTRLEMLDRMIRQIGTLREMDYNNLLSRETTQAIKADLSQMNSTLRREIDSVKYIAQRKAAKDAFGQDGRAPKYLNITPTAGSGEALSGGGWDPTDIPLNRQYRAALPPNETGDIDLDIVGNSERTMEVLVISGGHGGDRNLFETETAGDFYSREWWENQVRTLQQKGVRAKTIVIDACMSASMIKVFQPLVANGGAVVGYTQSINQMLFTPDFWKEIAEADSQDIPGLINRRLLAHTRGIKDTLGAHPQSDSKRPNPLAEVAPTAIYTKRQDSIRYDVNAVSEATETRLDDGKDKAELKEMRATLRFDKAVPINGFVPDLIQDKGSPVVAASIRRTAKELVGWQDENWENITAGSVLRDGSTIVDESFNQYEVAVVANTNPVQYDLTRL